MQRRRLAHPHAKKADARKSNNGALGGSAPRNISAPDKYRPSDNEPFMNERQRDYFRAKLLKWREDILQDARETIQHLQDDNQNHADPTDRACSEADREIELRARERQRKLIVKIDAALVVSRTAPTATARK